MTNLARVRVALSGWEGAPGVNTLYFSPGTAGDWSSASIQGVYDEVHAAFSASKTYLIQAVKANIEQEVAIIDPGSGDIVDMAIVGSDLPEIEGDGSARSLSRATQVVIGLKTGVWRNGRQLQGRLFFGPAQGGCFGTDGRVTAGVASGIEDNFLAMTSGLGARLCVWSRPRSGGTVPGYYEDVNNIAVALAPGILRSRRD